MVREAPYYSLWEKIKRYIAFLLCPEFRNNDVQIEFMQENMVWVYSKWHKDVRCKERGISRLNKRIKTLENENQALKEKVEVQSSNGANRITTDRLLAEKVS